MYKTTFLGVLEAEKLQKHKCTLFSETPCIKSDVRFFSIHNEDYGTAKNLSQAQLNYNVTSM